MTLSIFARSMLGLGLVSLGTGCLDGGLVERHPTLPRQPGAQPVVSRFGTQPTFARRTPPPVLASQVGGEPTGFAVTKIVPATALEQSVQALEQTEPDMPAPDPVGADEPVVEVKPIESIKRTGIELPPQALVPPGPNSPPSPHRPNELAKRQTPRAGDPLAPPPIPSVIKDEDAPMHPPETIKLKQLYEEAAARCNKMDSYVVRLRRREQINGKDRPEELMTFKFRKAPFSVYFKWLGIEGRGREVVYVKDQFGDKLHTLLAAGDMPLMPAGKRMALAPDSIFVRSASRHAITEAGFSYLIESFGRSVRAVETNPARSSSMKYLGQLKRPEFEKPVDAVEQVIGEGQEALLPKGGARLWLFDTDNHLPVLTITTNHVGHEVEYYCYDRLQWPVKLDNEDFNPDLLWRNTKP